MHGGCYCQTLLIDVSQKNVDKEVCLTHANIWVQCIIKINFVLQLHDQIHLAGFLKPQTPTRSHSCSLVANKH